MLEITREAGGYACRFGYDAELVTALKRAVPGRHRRWDPKRKAWLVSVGGWPLAERVFVEYGLLEGLRTSGTAWDTLHLQPTAPPELVTAAYRTLAKLHHPDRGGSTERMRDLNLAFEKLRQQ
ncbi:MAG: J domain-containing protein [Dehalococcoidia bacterium]|nr:J domain-containing protein [Dehalococcoidia bacterium]